MNESFVILITLLFSAFFSGIEIAFVTVNKLRIELSNKQGEWSGKILSWYLKEPAKFISTTLIGNNIALVIYGIYSGKILEGWLNDIITQRFWLFVAVTIISTLIVLITAEFLPKTLCRINPDLILRIFILPFHVLYFILWPIVTSILWIAKKIIKLITNENYVASKPVFTRYDLDQFISQTNQIELDNDTNLSTEMFKNALDFGSLKVRDCMVPRTELIAISQKESLDELIDLFKTSNHSKILVYQDSIDNITGYVHQVNMFKNPKGIAEMVMPILITNESRSLHDQLKDMIQKRKSIAVVVDEFGLTAGIVTIEDIIEQIFGEIDDEFDTEHLKETTINDGHYIFSGRHTIAYLNETYSLNIPEGDYETLGGYIIYCNENIPSENDVIITPLFEITIKEVKHARIEEVELQTIKEGM